MKNTKKVVVLLLSVVVSGLLLPDKARAMLWGNLSDPAYSAWLADYLNTEWYYTHVSGGGDPMLKVLGFYEDDEITFYSEIYVSNNYWYQTWGWDDGTYCRIYLGADGNAYLRGNDHWYMYSAWDNSWVAPPSQNPPLAH